MKVTHLRPFTIGPLEGKPAVEVMNEGIKQLKCKHWLSSGTLIGIYRDNKIIPFDTDIDVNVLFDIKDTPEIKLDGFDLIRTVYHNEKPMQTAYIKDDVIFDIYYFYTGIKEDYAVNYNPEGYIEKPLRFVDSLGEVEFQGKKYPIPNHIEDFLVWRFGKDWKVPAKKKVAWQTEATHLRKWV